MRRVVLAAMLFATAMSAQAADMPDFLRGSLGGAASTVNWQGFYVGGQAGTGTSDMNFNGATQNIAAQLLAGTAIDEGGRISSLPLGGKISVHGNGFGGFAGYNGQWTDVVLGMEFSYLHGKFGGSATDSASRFFTDALGFNDSVTYRSTSTVAISDMGTLRIRGGYAIDRFLPYLFGGIALGQANIVNTAEISGTQTMAFLNIPFDVRATDGRFAHFIYGYSAGLGVDINLIGGLFARAEWEYVRFTSQVDTNVNTVRAGLGYKF
ncbi:MAG TPA: outer membrane beta-barrel protein [Bradyrhizobium sp.]|nr:outer membrane beta-barrel protein [Bradyrhizobium sp.]